VFGGASLASENVIPPGLGWSGNGKGWIMKRDPFTTPGGIFRATLLEGGPGRNKIAVEGKGPQVGAASTPLATPVTAQLVSSDGLCFAASYASPTFNSGGSRPRGSSELRGCAAAAKRAAAW